MTENEKLRALLAEAREPLALYASGRETFAIYSSGLARSLCERIDAALAEPAEIDATVIATWTREQYERAYQHGVEASLLAEREHSARLQREAEERHDELRAEIERLRSLTPSGTYSLDRNHEQERQRLVTERDEARACEAEAMRAREMMARMVAVYRSRLEKLTACRCDEPWTTRGLHEFHCRADEGWLDEPTAEEKP